MAATIIYKGGWYARLRPHHPQPGSHRRQSLHQRHAPHRQHDLSEIGAGTTIEELLSGFPHLERDDILQSLRYAMFMAASIEPLEEVGMEDFDRITRNPTIMGGKACIRGMRVTVGMIVGQIAAGHTPDDLLKSYPYLEREDIVQALRYASWLASEREVVLKSA